VPTLRELIRAWNKYADEGSLTVLLEGAVVGDQDAINLHEGQSISLSVADDAVDEEVDITIAWDGLAVRRNSGAVIGTRPQINLIEGANIALTMADDPADGEVDITIASSASYTDEQAQDAVGSILTDTTTINFTYNDGANTIIADWNGLTVRKNSGADVGTRTRLNLIEGANIALTVADDAGGGEVDVTITGSASYTDEQAQDAVGTILTDSATIDFTYNDAANTITAVTIAAGVVAQINALLDHGTLLGLADDDHTQYLKLAGRAGGQTAQGGTAASENLNLQSTAHATKGYITLDGLKNKLASGDTFWVASATNSVFVGSNDTGRVASASGAIENTGIGDAVLSSLTSGDDNTAVGYRAGNQINSGGTNTVVGSNAGRVITTGTNNVAVGSSAMGSLTGGWTGSAITAVGHLALANIQGGSIKNSVAVGYQAAQSVSTITNSVVVGATALNLATTATVATSVVIGTAAVSSSAAAAPIDQVIIGSSAMTSSTSSKRTVAIGTQAGLSVTTSTDCVLIGDNVAGVLQSSHYNTVIGSTAAAAMTGSENVVIGYGAAPTLTVGDNNIVIGVVESGSTLADVRSSGATGEIILAAEGDIEGEKSQTLMIATLGDGGAGGGNVLIGSHKPGNYKTASGNSNLAIGQGAGKNLTSGSSNIFIGAPNVGATVTTGGSNILIGVAADAPAADTSNHLNIASTIWGDLSGLDVRLGGSGAVSQNERLAVTDTNADTVEVFSLETTGANGNKTRMRVGTQVPEALVTGSDGDYYLRVNDKGSRPYVNRTTTSGTDWEVVGPDVNRLNAGNSVINNGFSRVVAQYYEIAAGKTLELEGDACLEIS